MVRNLEGGIVDVADGTGLVTAKQFEGAQVSSRHPNALDADMIAIGPDATGVRGDASSPSKLSRPCDQVEAQTWRIADLLVKAEGGTLPSSDSNADNQ